MQAKELEGVVIGLDWGASRIGAAVGNLVSFTARPLGVLDGRTREARWNAVAGLISEWRPAAVVVGVPRHPDGAPHEATAAALRFARQVEGRFGVPVYCADERYSSAEAESRLRAGGRAPGRGERIDDEAAAVILQQWLDEGCPRRTAREDGQ